MSDEAKSARHWLLGYKPEWLRSDVVAGLTTSAVVVPKCMAFAGIAGMPLEIGLYAALVPMIIYAVLGTSRRLSVSTTTTISILVAGKLALAVPDGGAGERLVAVVTLTMLVGAFLVLAGILRLGFLANFISDPVLTGFKAGIALVIVVDQLPKLLGVHIEKSGFLRNIAATIGQLAETSVPTFVLALIMLVLIIGLSHFFPKVPSSIVAVVLSIAAVWLFGLDRSGIEVVGAFEGGFPALMLPDLSMVESLWPGALGIALMAFTESIAAGRSFTQKGEPRPEANRELIALGLANLAGGLTQAIPSGGGTSQTAVNSGAGAHTQLSELVTAGVVAATLLFLGPVIGLLPNATLAAVVVATTIGLIKPHDFRAIAQVRSTELIWAVVACVGVVLLGTLQGILVAVALSVLTLFIQATRPPVYAMVRKPGTSVFRPRSKEHPDDETFPGLLLIRTEGRMNFASAPNLSERMWQLIDEVDPRVLVFDFSAIPDIEYTALSMLTAGEEKLRERGIALWLSGLNPEPLRVVSRSPLGKILGRERTFFNLESAVEAFLESQSDGSTGVDSEGTDSS